MILFSLLLCLAGCTNVAQMQQKYAAGDHKQLDNLVEIVSRPDYPYATRKNAARALGEIGSPKGVPALISVLWEFDRRTTLKEEALKALGKIGDTTAVDPIGKLLDRSLDQSSAELRMAALPVLGSLGGDKAATILVHALRYYDLLKLRDEYQSQKGVFSGEEQFFLDPADSLGRGRRRGPAMGLFADEQMPTTSMFGTEMHLEDLELPDPTPEERALAHAALVRVGNPAVPVIAQYLATQELTASLRQELLAIAGEIQQPPPDTTSSR